MQIPAYLANAKEKMTGWFAEMCGVVNFLSNFCQKDSAIIVVLIVVKSLLYSVRVFVKNKCL